MEVKFVKETILSISTHRYWYLKRGKLQFSETYTVFPIFLKTKYLVLAIKKN